MSKCSANKRRAARFRTRPQHKANCKLHKPHANVVNLVAVFSDVSSGQLFALKFSDWLNCFQQSCPKAEPSLDHCLWISGQSRSNHGSFELGHGFHGSHCPHHSCPFQVELGIDPRGARPPPPRKACGNPAAWASGVGGPRSLACARGALAGLTSGRPPPPRAACTNPASTSHLPWPLG